MTAAPNTHTQIHTHSSSLGQGCASTHRFITVGPHYTHTHTHPHHDCSPKYTHTHTHTHIHTHTAPAWVRAVRLHTCAWLQAHTTHTHTHRSTLHTHTHTHTHRASGVQAGTGRFSLIIWLLAPMWTRGLWSFLGQTWREISVVFLVPGIASPCTTA